MILAAALALALPAGAVGQYSAAVVINNGVVTEYDVEQRMLLLDALGAQEDLRELALEQLTEDRVKVQAARALGIELPEGAIETGLEEFATSRGLSVDDVVQVLVTRDIDRQAMDDFVESGLLWREVVATRFRARATPSEEEIDAALEMAATTPREQLELSEIALPFAERGQEETVAFADQLAADLRRGGDFAAAARRFSRSSSGAQGGRVEPMDAMQLPPAIRSQVLVLRPGQIAGPLPISGGVAILKLDRITQVRPEPGDPEDPAVREELRRRLFTERIELFGQGYLQELLSDALIEVR